MRKKHKSYITVGIFIISLVCISVAIASFMRNKPAPILVNEALEKTTISTTKKQTFDYKELSLLLTSSLGREISDEAIKKANLDFTTLETMLSAAKANEIDSKNFYQYTGYTINAFIDAYGNATSKNMGNNGKDSFVLGFIGDINFDETSFYVMVHALTKPNLVLDCIDNSFQTEMKNADIMLVNNEFPYTDRGSPTPDKKYTFRAKPEYVKYMNDMGVDIVSLANNHAYDYGYDSFVDTIDTLNKADIVYVGAGMNLDKAKAVKTFIINGYKVGYIACSGVESPIKTPVATEDSAGILGSYYDGAQLVADTIKDAKTYCDYVIVYPHWGFENTTELSNGQKENSRLWIDAGADAVIGDHSHCLQGMDYYKGKFIAYSMGNFWFNGKNSYTGLLKLEICKDKITPIFVPGTQYDKETKVITDKEEMRKVYNLLEGYPTINGVIIDDNGVISPKK